MSVEIMSVSLSDESVEALARRLAQLLGRGQAITDSSPPSAQYPQNAEAPASAPQADPWMNATPAPPAPQYQQQPPAQPQYQQPAQQPQAQVPTCAHGVMRYVPAGTSQSTGRSYPAFYGCPLPRGAQGKCQSVQA